MVTGKEFFYEKLFELTEKGSGDPEEADGDVQERNLRGLYVAADIFCRYHFQIDNDWILTKIHHRDILMIEKDKNYIIDSVEDEVLNIEKKDIERYLSEVKEAVGNDRYRLDRNAKRQDNINLFLNYVIDEAKAKEIILSLTVMDFSEILQNEHKGFEHERLYVFGKEITLLERNGTEEKTVSLYIKFNKLENCFVIVISFHEQKYPLTYYFK